MNCNTKKYKEDAAGVSFRAPQEVIARLDEIARGKYWSRSTLINVVLKEWLETQTLETFEQGQK